MSRGPAGGGVAGPGGGGGREPGDQCLLSRATPRPLRSSVLGKVLAALVLVLVVSTAVTAVVDARLTRAAVAGQTRDVADSNLRVLQEAFTERQRELVLALRNLGSRLDSDGLTDPARRPELIARLGVEVTNLELDQLDVVDGTGAALDPPVSVGALSPVLPFGRGAGFTTEPTSRLVATVNGVFVQAVPVTVGTGPDALVLVGGREFGDNLAFRLRRQLGGLAGVILVVGDAVAGSTLSHPVTEPPGRDDRTGELPDRPRVTRLAGEDSLVAYVPVGRSAASPVGGALGIALPDPAADLARALAVRRVVAGSVMAALAVALGWLLFRAMVRPLVELAGTAERIASGERGRPFVARSSDEIGRLAVALDRMRTELEAKLALVERQAAQLRESSQRVVTAQDEERRRLARDLHDGIQQQLLVLRMTVNLGIEDGAGADALAAELDRTIEQLREVSHNLYPAILRDRGLTAALRSYASRLPLPSSLDLSPDPLPALPADVETAAYFLMFEAVTNALKHSGATELALALDVSEGRLRVSVTDDGRGFDAKSTGRNGGLLHMEDRARSFGGDLRIESRPGHGTSVVATFPVPPAPGTETCAGTVGETPTVPAQVS
ncbi:MAG: ATP-binding protein [Actinomycetota bacterium]